MVHTDVVEIEDVSYFNVFSETTVDKVEGKDI